MYANEFSGEEMMTMKRFVLSVASVDGETEWIYVTPQKEGLLEFLETYDHEGSSIALSVPFGDTLYGEDIYTFLGEGGV